MIREQTTKSKAGTRKGVRIWRHGMSQMADRLGVSRTHLWYVVKGIRRSPRIERDKAFQTWRRSLR